MLKQNEGHELKNQKRLNVILQSLRWLTFSKCLSVVTICSLGLLPTMAKADLQSIRAFDTSAWGSFGGFSFNYKEPTSPPDLPDSERGWLPSAAIGGNYMSSGNLYGAVEGSFSFGNVPYKGAYLYFPTVPVQSNTQETIYNIDGKIGQGFALGKNAMVIPYLEMGFRYWDRNLGGGQVEDYQNMDALGGVMLQVTPINSLLLSAYASAGTTFVPQMKSSGTTYNLGDSGMYKIGAKVGYDLTRKIEIFTTVDYDHFRYAQSAVASDGTYEPSSSTEETNMRIGVAYHFR